jgi:hypothetical protein
MFEMTNASKCHRDAVFVCGGDGFVVFDSPPRLETGVSLAIFLDASELNQVPAVLHRAIPGSRLCRN